MTEHATPTPLDMITQLHRLPDGTRPLVVGRHSSSLWCSQAEQRLACHMVAQSATYRAELPRRCQRVIQPGLFYLVHQPTSLATGKLLGRLSYCAPCAVAEWRHWHVSEAQ